MSKDRFNPNSQSLGGVKGAKGGGSKPTPQTQRMRQGSGQVATARNHPQKLRG